MSSLHFYLGNFLDQDTNETNNSIEPKSDFFPRSGGSKVVFDNPKPVRVAFQDNDRPSVSGSNRFDPTPNGQIEEDFHINYQSGRSYEGSADRLVYTLPGETTSHTEALDWITAATVKITLKDGREFTPRAGDRAIVYQSTRGDIFIGPEKRDGSGADMFNREGNSDPNENYTYEEIETLEFIRFSASGQYVSVSDTDTSIACFIKGSLIETQDGAKAVEMLQLGDLVRTADAGFQPIIWSESCALDTDTLAENPNLRPIRIVANALGKNLPKRDLVVSPQHRILLRSRIVKRCFDVDEILVPAKGLLGAPGIDVDEDSATVTYFHFMCTRHQVVYAEGLETETLYVGPEAMKGISAEARTEIFALFPELADPDFQPEGARTFATVQKTRKLVKRHLKNRTPLCTKQNEKETAVFAASRSGFAA